MKIKVLQQSMLIMTFLRMDELYGRCTALGTSSGKAHLSGYDKILLLHESRFWLTFHRPVLTVFRYEIFRDRGLENGSLARVPDAGKKKKKKTFGIRLEHLHLLPRNEDRITTLRVQDADVTRGRKNQQPTS